MATAKSIQFEATSSSGSVSALLLRPRGATALYVLAHGAGAGMSHPFMEEIAEKLYDEKIATFRYQFPYMESGGKRPDVPRIAEATVRSAVAAGAKAAKGLPILAGGKSFGGRMSSSAQSREAIPGLVGLAFLGFPLHAPGKPGAERAAHLFDVSVPMLFLQGTRDSLATLDQLKPVCKKLGRRAVLQIIEGGDHSFKVPKKLGRPQEDVMKELANTISEFVRKIS